MDVERAELELDAPRGVRVVALRLLDDASAAAAKLDAGGSDSALHDFRVAIRRLRSWLRAFDDALHDAVPGRARRKLKSVADMTSDARDREVALEWLVHAGERRRGARRQAAEWLQRFYSAGDDASDDRRAAIAKDFPKARDALTRALTPELASEPSTDDGVPRIDAGTAAPTLAHAMADRIGPHLLALHEAAAHVHAASDEAAAHETRIVAKRLRYLIEAARAVSGAPEILNHLRALQDALGALHDAHVLAHELRRILGRVAKSDAKRASSQALGRALAVRGKGDTKYAGAPRDGILLLMRQLRRDINQSFGEAGALLADGARAELGRSIMVLEARLRERSNQPSDAAVSPVDS